MTLSFVGMGNMAYAIARGLLEAGALKGEQVSAYDPNPQKARTLEQDFGVRCLEELGQAAKADLVVLAVKPNVIEQVVGELKSLLEGKAVLCIALGWRFKELDAVLPASARHLSVMPNTPMQVGEGMCIFEKKHTLTQNEHDAVRGNVLIQLQQNGEYLVQNKPMPPLSTEELDAVYALPYARTYHPCYEKQGGVPAIKEVQFSITHNRGCFGACNFCSIAFHQGRQISVRSEQSVLSEARLLTKMPGFKGYIHDVGGPTANFRHTSCEKQLKLGLCRGKKCLAPTPCKNLTVDHRAYLNLLQKVRQIPGIKRVFIRSGIRFDYLIEDTDNAFFKELVQYHVSGQLKVAPEHCSAPVLDKMGKPHIEAYLKFQKRFYELTKSVGKEQYLVPYLMSSHPGSTLKDAVYLAEYLYKNHMRPEQVQDFYPTPGTISTCMYYTGIDPTTMKSVYVAKTFHEKAMQRALLQWKRPDKRRLVIEALKEAGREDLIGYGPECLVRPDAPQQRRPKNAAEKPPEPKKPQNKQGWAKAKPKKNTRPGKGKR